MVRAVGRRTLLRSAIAAGAAGLAGCQLHLGARRVARTQTVTRGPRTSPPSEAAPPAGLPSAVDLKPVVTDIEQPVSIAVNAAADCRYIATNAGQVRVHDTDGLLETPLVDLRDRVAQGYEMGLLGIELHPDFPADPRLFIRYSAPPRPGTPPGYSHTFVLASFEVASDGMRVVPDAETTVMEIPEPQPAHNAGDLAFGPDGLLYVPTGDGGAFGDTAPGHVDDWYPTNGGGNGQDTAANLLGGILRIDVDAEPAEHPRTDPDAPADPTGGAGYTIPGDNPLVDAPGHRDEYYAWGFRNPWRLSYDQYGLLVGDVGQDLYEEVNLVERGANYGWNVREGPHCFDRADLTDPLDTCPDRTPPRVRGGEPLRDPILGYPHAEETEGGIGTAVIGGSVYHGTAIPGLVGRYVFGSLRPNGQLFVGLPPDGERSAEAWRRETVPFTDDAARELTQLLAFGRDATDELYVLGGQGVYRLVPAG